MRQADFIAVRLRIFIAERPVSFESKSGYSINSAAIFQYRVQTAQRCSRVDIFKTLPILIHLRRLPKRPDTILLSAQRETSHDG